MTNLNLAALRDPFPADQIEWRLQTSGEKNGKVWAICLAYVTNRAIMDRLDETVGPENWCNEFKEGPGGGVLCGISIRIGGAWVTKWDGAENTDVEAVKGGLSGASKRAAVQWGIGRYLYDLEEGFAVVSENGKFRGQTKDRKQFRWNPPALPAWALPGKAQADDDGEGAKGNGKPQQQRPPAQDKPVAVTKKDEPWMTKMPIGRKKGTLLGDLSEKDLESAANWIVENNPEKFAQLRQDIEDTLERMRAP